MRRVTLSTLQRASICTASVVLPRYDWTGKAADLGNAIHEVIDAKVKGEEVRADVTANTWELTGIERGRFFSVARGFNPKVPPGALSEVALGLFDDGETHEVEGGRGEYAEEEGLKIPGTIDVLWSEPAMYKDADGQSFAPDGATLYVVDWKTGDEGNVPPPATNWQLRAGAVLAARWTGATRVIPAICFVDASVGRWDIGAPIESAELDSIESTLVEILNDIELAASEYEKGVGPRAVTGPHCEHCPARPGCSAHVAEVRALVAPTAWRDLAKPMTPEEASHLAGLLPAARKVLELATAALKTYVTEHGPIPVADGRVYGPLHASRTSYATRVSYEALAAEIGNEAADAAFSTSKGAIYDAISDAHDANGIKRKKGAASARVLATIAEKGGTTTRPIELWKPHYPGAKGNEES